MHIYFASTYGSNSYNTANYDGTNVVSGSTGGSSSAGGGTGVLTDTGIALAAVVTLACLIMLAAMVIRVWKRPARKLAAETADSNTANTQPRA